jgi:ParB family chromosome partitioning protein
MMPVQPTLANVTIDRLAVSPLNVRTNREDAEATEALEASIEARGLLLPLVVHPLREEAQAEFGVLAGGRRLRALQRLVGAGRIPADTPIPIVVRDLDPAEITELSLAENLLRRELRPYEVHAAIARASGQGATVEEIAANIGQRVQWVEQQLRLGRLAPEIFEAYASGKISIDQARAYGATEDQELQRAAWTHFSARREFDRHPHHIRAWLKVDDRELQRLLRFVGDEAYRGAGGRFELDLFADGPDRGRIVDEGTLRELAENKLAHLRSDLRRRTGRSDLRFAVEPPQHNGYPDQHLSFEPPRPRRTAGEQRIQLPDGADVIATIEITESGEAQIAWWWSSRKAKRDAERKAAVSGDPAGIAQPARPVVTRTGSVIDAGEAFDASNNFTVAQAARAAVKDEHGLTADGLHVMRSIRREILRGALCANALGGGSLGQDYIVWAQLRQELPRGSGAHSIRAAHTGARGLVANWSGSEDAEPVDAVQPHLDEARAHTLWETTLCAVKDHPAFVTTDPADAFSEFYGAGEAFKRVAGAVLAGLAMLRSANVPGWRVAAHDRLAELAGVDDAAMRELWQPTPAFMALFPKMKRLELARPHVGAEHFRAWHKLSDPILTGATAGALEQAQGWVHPLLSFGVAPEQSEASNVGAIREVAE